jgi:hypothetical protein
LLPAVVVYHCYIHYHVRVVVVLLMMTYRFVGILKEK